MSRQRRPMFSSSLNFTPPAPAPLPRNERHAAVTLLHHNPVTIHADFNNAEALMPSPLILKRPCSARRAPAISPLTRRHLSRRSFNEGETNDSQLLTFL